MRFGLYPKLIFLMLALAVIPVGFAGFQLISLSERGIESAILELHTKLAEKLAQGLNQYLDATDEKIRFTIFALERPLDWRQKQLLLEGLLKAQEGAAEVALLNAKGAEVMRVFDPALGSGKKLGDHSAVPEFARMLESGERRFRLATEAGLPKLRGYYPLRGGLAFTFSLIPKGPWQSIETERVGGTGFAILVDQEGTPILYPRDQGIDPARFRDLQVVRQGLRSLAVGSSAFLDPGGSEMVGAYAPLPSLGGAVLILQPRGEAFALARQMRVQATLVLVLCALLALVISIWTARRISLPILKLTRGAEAVARGDFSKVIDIQSEDELKDLAETFNRMTAELRKYQALQVDRVIAEEQRTQAILFSIADGILMTDYEGRLQLANRSARFLLGLSQTEDLEGKSLQELLPDAEVRAVLEEVATRPQESLYKEIDLSTDLYRKIFRVSAEPVVQPGKGTPLGVVTALHDVTLEKELDKIKEEFVQSMTHDLRSPMASIRGFLEILLKGETGPLTPVQRKMLESMDKASFRLLGMINNILDMAKVRSGRMEIQLSPTSVADVAERVLETMMPLAGRKGIEMVMNGGSTGKIQADPDLLERVFTNLISNAIKFTPEAGKVLITIRDALEETRVSVEDTGHGIPSEYRDQIFQKFVQVRGQRAGGTGLGLTICKHIVELHRGRIWVESEPEHGSRFYFTLSKKLTASQQGDAAAVLPAA